MRHRRLSLFTLVLTMALVASACGGDDDDTVSEAGGDGVATETDAADTGGEDTGGETSAPDDTPSDSTTTAPPAPAATETPVPGGEITFGLEAETGSGLYPPSQQCAASCHTVMRAIYDPLFTETTDGEIVPFLATGAEPLNDDFTEWAITAREGVTFHDGSAFDGASIVAHFDGLKTGTITAQVLQAYQSGTVDPADPLRALLSFNQPYGNLPEVLTGQLGYMTAPALHADPAAAATNPVGTGPFVFDSWNQGVELHVTRNPNYWRTDADGTQLPYLEGITFRPVPDNDARYDALASGDLDLLHTDLAEDFAELEENGATLVQTNQGVETEYVMLNAAVAPLDDPEFRRALAQCTSGDLFIEARTGGVSQVANGPFAPGAPGYLEDSGYPAYDPEAGAAAIEAIGQSAPIELQVTNSPWNVTSLELIAEMWNQCGVDTTISTLEQGVNITEALQGAFGALLWRNHGYLNPGPEYVWWHSNHSGPVGGLAVANFGRIEDPDIDASLDALRLTRDPAEIDQISQDVNRTFAEQVYNIWLEWRPWVVAHNADVHNVGANAIPDGSQSPTVFSGRIFLAETFVGE